MKERIEDGRTGLKYEVETETIQNPNGDWILQVNYTPLFRLGWDGEHLCVFPLPEPNSNNR